MICLFPREAIHHHSKSMPQPLCWGSWSWMILWRPTRLPRTNTKKKDVLFILGDWNEKVGSQEIPGITGKFCLGVQNEARQRLTEFCKENTLVIASTHYQQHEKTLNMDITTWSVLKLDWLYSLQLKMEKLYSVSKNKTWSSLWLRSPAYLKIQDKLKKVEKTTRIFRYDLNKIPYDYTVYIIPEELWTEVHDIVQEAVIKTIPHFSSVQLLSRVWLFETPWIEVRQASLFITNSRSPPKLMSILASICHFHCLIIRDLI